MTEILLRELSNTDLDWMVSTGQQHALMAGDRLALTIAGGEYLYCLLDGELEAVGHNLPAPIQFKPGEIVGGETLLELPQSPVSLQAVTRSTVLALSHQALALKLTQDAGFAARFYRALALLLSQRLRRLYEYSGTLRYSPQRETLQEALLVLGELRDSDIDWLTITGQVRSLSPGDFLVQAGRPVDALHLILEGTFAVLWLDGEINPLKVCFNCPIETAGKMQQITTLTKGEMAGVGAFLDFRPLSVTIRAQEEAVVLSVPRQAVSARLQQDVEFSTRFHRVLALQLGKLLQTLVESSGAEAAVHNDAPHIDPHIGLHIGDKTLDEELDLDALQHASQGAARFNWMLQRLGVG